MATYEIETPDGAVYEVEADSEAKLQEVVSQLSSPRKLDPSEYDPASPEYQAKYGATSGMSPFQRRAAGAGQFLADLGRGAGQMLRAPGRGGTASLVSEQDVVDARQQDAALLATPEGRQGQLAGAVLSTVPLAFIPGANTVPGAALVGGGLGAAQPTAGDESRLLNAGLGVAFGAGGQYGGQKVAGYVGKKIAERGERAARDRAVNAVQDETLRAGQDAGYVVPPATTNPTLTNRILEGFGGKAATAQKAAQINQRVTDDLARKELGMGASTALSRESLKGVRTEAGKVYQAIKKSGEFEPDEQLSAGLAELAGKHTSRINQAARDEVSKLQKLWSGKQSAESVVDDIRALRHEARANLSPLQQDPAKRALGQAQREAAELLEDQLERHLAKIGKPELASEFRAARELIAKAHAVEDALNESTGHVVASRLGSQLRSGKPLSGGLRTAAAFSRAFPKATAEIRDSAGVSHVDTMIAGLLGAGGYAGAGEDAGLASVLGPGAAYLIARPGARAALLSRTLQGRAQPNYLPHNQSLEMMRALASRGGLLGVGSAQTLQQ